MKDVLNEREEVVAEIERLTDELKASYVSFLKIRWFRGPRFCPLRASHARSLLTPIRKRLTVMKVNDDR